MYPFIQVTDNSYYSQKKNGNVLFMSITKNVSVTIPRNYIIFGFWNNSLNSEKFSENSDDFTIVNT